MTNSSKLIVSHAPFLHNGSAITTRSYHMMGAALLAVIPGFFFYGLAAIGVVGLSIASAMLWEMLANKLSKQDFTIGDGNAALIGLLFAMLLPASAPFWLVITGTFVAVIIGKQIFGGTGANPFNPALLGLAILTVSWKDYLDFNAALIHFDLNFDMIYPLSVAKSLTTGPIEGVSTDGIGIGALLIGKQPGGIGSTFGIGLIIGGIYLIIRGFIRWEISVSFLVGVFVTALLFNLSKPEAYAGPMFHLLTGYTLIGAFFLAVDDASSPVNFVAMLIYGAGAGIMTVLIRNIGAYVDGVVFAILLMNLANPLIDNIRPKAIGKAV